MKILVTGGSGFVGSHVVDKIRDRSIEVRVFDMVMPTFRRDVEFYQGSILDLEAIRMALNGVDAVYHLAAVSNVKDVQDDPHYAESINVRGTINLLEAVRRSSGVKRVIYGSSTLVYSETADQFVNEQTPLKAPSHLFTATKLASEYYCQSYSRLYKVPITILRYGMSYGPRARDGGIIPTFVAKAFKGEPLPVPDDGWQCQKLVYVEDLAEGSARALKSVAENKIYNLDGTDRITIKQIAETVQRVVASVALEYGGQTPGDMPDKEVSTQLAKSELGWEPRVPLEEGVRRYAAWYRERVARAGEVWGQVDEIFK